MHIETAQEARMLQYKVCLCNMGIQDVDLSQRKEYKKSIKHGWKKESHFGNSVLASVSIEFSETNSSFT